MRKKDNMMMYWIVLGNKYKNYDIDRKRNDVVLNRLKKKKMDLRVIELYGRKFHLYFFFEYSSYHL